jgi:hypothetical protein
MPVPSSINDLSTTAGSNSPAGSESPTDGDAILRAHASFIALLRDKFNGTSATGEINDATFAGTMAGAATWSALQTFAGGIAGTTAAFTGAVSGTTGTFTGAVSGSNLTSSTYTPTGTAVGNIDSVTPSVFRWARVGAVVMFSGQVSLNTTNEFTGSSFRLSLPVASNFTAATNASGTAVKENSFGPNSVYVAGKVTADATNDQLLISFVTGSGDDASSVMQITGSYDVV